MDDAEFQRKIGEIAKSISLRVAWIDLHYHGEELSVTTFVQQMDDLVSGGFLYRTTDTHEVDRYTTIVHTAENVQSVIEAIRKATTPEWRTIPEIVRETGQQEGVIRKQVPILVAIGILDEAIGHQPWKVKWNTEVDEVFKNLDTWMASLTRIRRQIDQVQAELDIHRLGYFGELR
jgi:hypothetical protein